MTLRVLCTQSYQSKSRSQLTAINREASKEPNAVGVRGSRISFSLVVLVVATMMRKQKRRTHKTRPSRLFGVSAKRRNPNEPFHFKKRLRLESRQLGWRAHLRSYKPLRQREFRSFGRTSRVSRMTRDTFHCTHLNLTFHGRTMAHDHHALIDVSVVQ